MKTAQTASFSIHLQAQFKNLDFNNLTVGDYDKLEKDMLVEFSKFVKKHSVYKWIHWNMRDSNYGFEAINNRLRILGGQPFDIHDDLKYDLPRVLGKIYTYGYERNQPKGRLLNLAERNRITTKEALTGQEEADAFTNKEYLRLHISTLRKVDIIDSLIERVEKGKLKVNASRKEIYGLTVMGVLEIIRSTSWLIFLVSILGYIIGAALEPIVQKLLGTGN